MSGVFSIHNAAPPLPATAWPTTMVAGGTLGRLANDHGGGWYPQGAAAGLTRRGEPRPTWRSPTDLISYPSVQYLARRDTPPLPVAPNRGHIAHFFHLDKRKTIYSFPIWVGGKTYQYILYWTSPMDAPRRELSIQPVYYTPLASLMRALPTIFCGITVPACIGP